MMNRFALVTGLALLLGAALLAFLPTSTADATCGIWMDPEWGRERSQALAEDAAGLGREGESLALEVATNYRQCADALATKRTVSIGLLAGAALAPAAIWFVGRPQRQTATA